MSRRTVVDCDRCSNIGLEASIQVVLCTGRLFNGVDKDYIEHIKDLCPKCAEELIKWFLQRWADYDDHKEVLDLLSR